ncbi:hypothetical protein BA898_05160 [Spiribacter roseus]|nr:hypothetical protein BA898_05160 [Spiribacter roseus]
MIGQVALAWTCDDVSVRASRSISLGMLVMEQGRSGWVIVDAINDGPRAATSPHVAISGWGDPPRTGEVTVIGPAGVRVEIGIDLFTPQDRSRDSDWVELRQIRVGDPPQSLDPNGPRRFTVDLGTPGGRARLSPDGEIRLVRRQIPIGMELELKKAQGGRQIWEREVVARCLAVNSD